MKIENNDQKQKLIDSIISMGGKPDEEVSNVFWLHGHCMHLIQDKETNEWEFDEL